MANSKEQLTRTSTMDEFESHMQGLITQFEGYLEKSKSIKPSANPQSRVFQYRDLNEAHMKLSDCAMWAKRFGSCFPEERIEHVESLLEQGASALLGTPYKGIADTRCLSFRRRITANIEAYLSDLDEVA